MSKLILLLVDGLFFTRKFVLCQNFISKSIFQAEFGKLPQQKQGVEMFEVAELGHSVEHSVYKEKSALLGTELLTVQDRLKASPFPVISLISGVGGGGRLGCGRQGWRHQVFKRSDGCPRNYQVMPIAKPSDEEWHIII